MSDSSSGFKYKNITISGLPGSGTTTLLNKLREELKFEGWTGFSGGEFMRQYAVEKGLYDNEKKIHHDAEAYAEEFDRQVDFGIREKVGEEENWIIESWLSGFMAQGMPDVLKILVICSDDSVRVDRIVNRDEVTVEEAKKHIEERYQKNLRKWQRMYAQQWQEWVVQAGKAESSEPIDFWKPELYDMVIDTYSANKQQALDLVLEAMED
ncbi:MAG: AAA family ATPase [Candidatus Pacebacteria bacterium]|nr:AAA family ATPase [Candidatus Paceibacterota bacterium]